MSGLREVCLDTETTGMEAEDRIVEVGAVELIDKLPTGRTFQAYINPAPRRVHPGAFRVHGLSERFLADKPSFEDVAPAFLEFIAGARLVIHNAPFDVGMLNREFARLFDPPEPIRLDDVHDTLRQARRELPDMKSKGLDALAARFKVNAAARSKHHGALVDAEILAGVYRGLNPARQEGLSLEHVAEAGEAAPAGPRVFRSRITAEELARHQAFVAELGAGAVWGDYLGGGNEG